MMIILFYTGRFVTFSEILKKVINKTADKEELHQRYTSLGIPSDFFLANLKWSESFTPENPFSIRQSCQFHIMHEIVESPAVQDSMSLLLQPGDANYLFSAKVMLLELPPIEEIYKKCFENDFDSTHRPIHPWRLIKFLVGMRGDIETMAIGGPWSALLDGENPDKDPSVLIRTAIRTCKALTGINLSNCHQWHRFLEIYYHRQDDKTEDDYVETVVIYMPEMHSIMPSRAEWKVLHDVYNNTVDENDKFNNIEITGQSTINNKYVVDDDNSRDDTIEKDTITTVVIDDETDDEVTIIDDDSELETIMEYSSASTNNDENIDKEELNDSQQDTTESSHLELNENVKSSLPVSPHVVVRPNREAKNGKFNCVVKSLSGLLDYQPDDLNESSFEISLFAELFNDMLIRDFGFNIYKEINHLEKPKTKNKVCEITVEQNEIQGHIKQEFIDNDDENANTSSSDCKSANDLQNNDTQQASTIYENIINPELLMSFTYFDITHTGYIIGKDLEDLFYVLGLNQSHSQISQVLQKLENFDTSEPIYYRKLTHMQEPIECTPGIEVINMVNCEPSIEINNDDSERDTVFFISSNDSSSDSDCNISSNFSDKELVLTLIEEYSKIPSLLNTTMEELYNCKRTQEKKLYEILANNLNARLKMNLNLNLVMKKLTFVCNLYENEIERRFTDGKEANSDYQWLYDKLSFLETLVENKLRLKMNPLDDHILYDIIDVYKDYKSLWDTNDSAFLNHKKRSETMMSLLDEVTKKLNLFMDMRQLEQQLTYIHKSFAKDKKLRLDCKAKQTAFQPTFPCFYKCHFLESHESPFECHICNFTTDSKYLFKTHTNEHKRPKTFMCSECGKEFETVRLHKHHVKRHLRKKLHIKRFRCKFCTQLFATKEQCDLHRNSHGRLCNICKTWFSNEESYHKHMKWHEEKNRYFCHVCQQGFYLKISLNNHIKRHVEENDKTCDICNKTFYNSLYLYRHKERIHMIQLEKK